MESPFARETLGVYVPNVVRDALREAARREDRSVSYIAGRILREVMLNAMAEDASPALAVNFATHREHIPTPAATNVPPSSTPTGDNHASTP